MTGASVDTRDEWMRRTGPFYSLLVAGQSQTRLPLAASLHPSPDDVSRSRAWLPIAGLVLGGALALLAALLFETALVPVVVATLVVALGVFATGGWFESGLARTADALFRAQDGAEPGAPSVTISVFLVVLVLVKVTSLLGTEPAAWTGALIASHIVGRWTILLAIKLPGFSLRSVWQRSSDPRDDDPLAATDDTPSQIPGWRAVGIASAIAVLGAIIAGGGAGAVALVAPLVFAWLAGRRADPDGIIAGSHLAAAGALTEVAALLCFAAWSPAVT